MANEKQTEKNEALTVVVGLSGGVDSSVAAFLLKQKGFKVVGLHMKNADDAAETEDEQSIKDLCEKLDIKYHVVNYSNEMQLVKDYFENEYRAGRTPNPCVVCNREVKFKPFIDFANKIGADYFATGHYANIDHNNGRHQLLRAADESKDQTYFLNQLSQAQLEKAIFPLGNLTKQEARDIAEKNGFVSAHKKDSFDVCFIGSEKFKTYMEKNYPSKEGKIVDIKTNKVVGSHKGLTGYTIGQRKGLGIGGGKGATGDCWFVVEKDAKTNTLLVAQGNDDVLYSDALESNMFNWISEKPQGSFECTAKFRYRQIDQPVVVSVKENGSVLVEFKQKQRAITLGQYVVLYNGEKCVGGGTIDKIIKN